MPDMMKVPSEFKIEGALGSAMLEASIQSAEQGAGAGKGALRKIKMNAYNGGAMVLGGWYHPVVVELSGMRIGAASRPILKDHNPDRIIGHTSNIVIGKSSLSVEGVHSGAGAAAEEVAKSSDNGFPWQSSIGARAEQVYFIKEKESVFANGKEFKGALYLVAKSTLKEISFVALGADDATSASISAGSNPAKPSFLGVYAMEKFEQWLKALGWELSALSEEQKGVLKAEYERQEAEKKKSKEANAAAAMPPAPDASAPASAEGESTAPQIQAEVKKAVDAALASEGARIAEIQEICGSEFPAIAQQAVRERTTPAEVRKKVLAAFRENNAAEPGLIVRGEHSRDEQFRIMEAALCLRAGLPEQDLSKEYGDKILSAAYPQREISLQAIMMECARAEGKTVPRIFGNDTIRAAFSTLALPGLLSNTAGKILLRSYNEQPSVALRLCSSGDLNDFKVSMRYRLNDVGDLQPLSPAGEIEHGKLSEESAQNQLKTFGKMIILTREMIFNDDLNAFMRIPAGLGARAKRKIEQLFFTRLLGQGATIFTTAHKNYSEGAGTALSASSLASAIQMFLDQVDADNQPIAIPPAFLVVPTNLKFTAAQLLNSVMLLSKGGTDATNFGTFNPLANENLELLSSPYLKNTAIPGYSTTAFYLFANPATQDTFEIGYLRGRRAPTVEQGEVNFNTLGIAFRVYFDIGIREIDHRGMVKFKGSA